MEVQLSSAGQSFGIDSLLSHRPASLTLTRDSSVGESGSLLDLSPRSDPDSGCSSPASPRRRHGFGLDSSGQHGPPVPPRATITSSFLIRDILADCKPLAACAPYLNNGQPEERETFESKLSEDYIHSNSSSDNEYKGKMYYCSSLITIIS